jgi:hypothetical protein
MILFFLSIILIIGSLAAMLFVDVVMLRYVSAAICLVGVYMMHLYWRNLFVKVRSNGLENNAIQQRQIAELQDSLEVATNENEALEARVAKLNHVPVMPETSSLHERIGILSNYFSDDITGMQKNGYNRLFAELEDAAATKSMIKAIGEHTTKPMVEELKTSSLPLDEEAKKRLESKLLCLALTAIDCTCGFKSGLNDTGSLATKVASGEISEAQAVRQAKEANENVYETPKEIRVLRELLNEYHSECKFVNDYKL